MIQYYKDFKPYDILEVGKRKKYDNNIYTFDIESTSFIVLDGKIYNNYEYENLGDKEQKRCEKRACMYVWQFGINNTVYYGRTWNEFIEFLRMIDNYCTFKKIIFVHNLSFEFQFLMRVLKFESVFARKSHKVMKAELENFNIEFRCSLFMSNQKLESLPKTYNLPVQKLVENLDYNLLRHSKTILSEEELSYCENDCLVLYYYIKYMRDIYEQVNKIPTTSTGQVRRELFNITLKDYKYKRKVYKAINTDPHVYNLLVYAFQGGYTHSNYLMTNSLLSDVDSWDITSSYPYSMLVQKYPSKEFKPCKVERLEDLLKSFAYLLVVRFKNVKSKFYNHFISGSKCFELRGVKYDNGRIIRADSFKMVLTDVDFKLYSECYDFEYTIEESYYSKYDYLPIQLVNFILEKYVKKTTYKGIKEKELDYNLEKAKFNSIYGMSVTRTISDDVKFDDGIWEEIPLSNEDIIEKLQREKKKSFLSFAYGCWVTAWSRKALIERIIDGNDKYCVYCDTDSAKLIQGYNKDAFIKYNESVRKKIEHVCKERNLDIANFEPTDYKGKKHLIGVFDFEENYQEFITQGAKKYAVKNSNGDIKITVAGVPKKGSKAMKDLTEFKDGFIFKSKDTNKLLLYYVDNQSPIEMEDYQGNKYIVNDISGCCLVPCSYTLGKALDYVELINDSVSERSVYNEN